jgi:hypothetical protein
MAHGVAWEVKGDLENGVAISAPSHTPPCYMDSSISRKDAIGFCACVAHSNCSIADKPFTIFFLYTVDQI